MESNLTTRQRQALKTKETILKCAMQLVSDVGFDKITINSICKKAGVSIGSFYYHFKSLDFIIIESYKAVDSYFENLDKSGYFNIDPINRINLIIKEQLKYAVSEGVDIITQFYKSQLTVGTEYFISTDRYLPKLIMNSIIEAQKDELLNTSLSPLEITADVLTISRGIIYDWCLKQGDFNLSKRGCKLVSIYIKSLHT